MDSIPETPWPLVTATSYKQESVAALIKQLKFYDNKEAAAPLGRLAAHALKEKNITQPLILVPVPLGKKRKRQRGYNQAERIAKEIALLLRIPVKTNILFRIRETKPQTEMSSSNQRQNNIEKCFRAIIKEPKTLRMRVLLKDVHWPPWHSGFIEKLIQPILR
jgi:predicted amidophosphoribosyltransferase